MGKNAWTKSSVRSKFLRKQPAQAAITLTPIPSRAHTHVILERPCTVILERSEESPARYAATRPPPPLSCRTPIRYPWGQAGCTHEHQPRTTARRHPMSPRASLMSFLSEAKNLPRVTQPRGHPLHSRAGLRSGTHRPGGVHTRTPTAHNRRNVTPYPGACLISVRGLWPGVSASFVCAGGFDTPSLRHRSPGSHM